MTFAPADIAMSTDIKALKEAHTTHAVHDLLRKRFSTRGFADRPLTSELLNTLFEGAAWAPSSMNEQPWRYYYALRGTDAFERAWECLTPGNKPWAKNAGALVVSTGSTVLHRNGEPNHYWLHDVGLANAMLLTQATSLDIFGHLMGGFDRDKANALLKLDTSKEQVACFIALGYHGNAEELVEPFKTREHTPRTRRALLETVTAL
jgi:nitroreductase